MTRPRPATGRPGYESSRDSKPNRLSLRGLERSIPNDMGDLLGEIVGGAQVFSHEAYLTLDVTIHERLPGVIGDADIQGHGGRSGDGGYLALFLAAFVESSRRGVQRDEVGRHAHVARIRGLDLDGRGRKLLRTLGIS